MIVAGSKPEFVACVNHFASSGSVIVSIIGFGVPGCVSGPCVSSFSCGVFGIIHAPNLARVSPIVARIERQGVSLCSLVWLLLFLPLMSLGCLIGSGCLWSMGGFLPLLYEDLPPLVPPPRPLVKVSFGLRFTGVGEDDSVLSSFSSSWILLLSKYEPAVVYEASDLLQFCVNSRPSMVSLAQRCTSSSTC